MDYEKAYKNALKNAQEGKPIEEIFPQLKKNKDEIMSEAAIQLIDGCGYLYAIIDGLNINKDDVIEWLKKQCGEKSIEKQDYSGLSDFERAIHRGFLCAGVENVSRVIIKETAQDALSQLQKSVEWSEEDEKMRNQAIKLLDRFGGDRNSGAYTFLEKDCWNAADWLKSIKDRVQPQSKHEWSEEDEMQLDAAIHLVDSTGHIATMNWLKSLKPQPHWKPSEE